MFGSKNIEVHSVIHEFTPTLRLSSCGDVFASETQMKASSDQIPKSPATRDSCGNEFDYVEVSAKIRGGRQLCQKSLVYGKLANFDNIDHW